MKKKCTPSPIEIGNNIRKLRLLKGFKQQQFADEISITQVALSKIETGKSDIKISRLCHMAEVLKVHITSFFHDPADRL